MFLFTSYLLSPTLGTKNHVLQQVALVTVLFNFFFWGGGGRDVAGGLFKRTNALFYSPNKPPGLQ